jgi:hypothetical protein
MAETESADPEIGEWKVTFVDVANLDPGGQGLERDGKDQGVHLAPQDLLERHVSLGRSEDAETVARGAEGLEEREPLDVVPVCVRQQQVGGDSGPAARHQFVAERAEAAPGVENHSRPSAPVMLRQAVLPP